jgi:hypothetical protein
MVNIKGKGVMRSFSREITLSTQVHACNLAEFLQMPEELAEELIVVRNHRRLDPDDLILDNDEIYLFLAVMGG